MKIVDFMVDSELCGVISWNTCPIMHVVSYWRNKYISLIMHYYNKSNLTTEMPMKTSKMMTKTHIYTHRETVKGKLPKRGSRIVYAIRKLIWYTKLIGQKFVSNTLRYSFIEKTCCASQYLMLYSRMAFAKAYGIIHTNSQQSMNSKMQLIN